jgi:hypothetical protein
MSTENPIVLSGDRLRQEALVFIGETGKVAEVFGKSVKGSTVAYLGELRASGEQLVTSTVGAATKFGASLQKEADTWRDLAIKTRADYVAAFQKRAGALEVGVTEAREAVRPDAVKVRALKTAHELLETAQKTVDEQIAQATESKAPAKAPPKRKPRKAKPAPRKTESDAPIRNYDQLTAKDVVARIQRLSPPQATAVLDYEQGRKKRATVIRAAKQRAAAS